MSSYLGDVLTKIRKWLRPRRNTVTRAARQTTLRLRRRSVMRGTLQYGGLGCITGSAFTIAATPINITIGLAVAGICGFVAEWLAGDA